MKCDHIGYSLLSIDNKIKLLDEEIEYLQSYKLKLQAAKKIASEVGASVFNSYGISKLEGGGISSITTTKSTVASKLHVAYVENEEELINQGFYTKVLDKKKILLAYNEGEYKDLIDQNAKILTLESITPSRLRINKRRSTNNPNYLNLDNEDVA